MVTVVRGLNLLLCYTYSAILKRENYFQFNSPTAFGNPQFNYYSGIVAGILQASGYEEFVVDNQIIIKKGNRKVLIIDKVKRSQHYYDSCKEINEVLQGL